VLTGFELTLPAGKTFRVRSDTNIQTEQQTRYLFNGGSQALALFEQFFDDGGQEGRADGLRQSAYLGAGAGVHRIQLEGVQYQDSPDEWGDAAPGDPPAAKRDELNNALNTTRITSEKPATLAFGEYSQSGRFDALPVAIPQSTIGVDTRNERSSVTVQLECVEAADLRETIHGTAQTED